MAGSFGGFGNIGGYVPYADMKQAALSLQFQANSTSSSGTTDTLSASQIVAGIFQRSGATAAVTATTDTAANIIAALGSSATPTQSFILYYTNNNTSSGAVTLAAGTGVTLSGTVVIPVGYTL